MTLQKQAGDGSTFVTTLTAFSAAGHATVDLPAGNYKIVIATASAVFVVIQRIPGE